jgi:hypothetical protein
MVVDDNLHALHHEHGHRMVIVSMVSAWATDWWA